MTRRKKLAFIGVLACSLAGFGAVSGVGIKDSKACYQNWGWPQYCECTGGTSVGGSSCRPSAADPRYCQVGSWCGGVIAVNPRGGWGGGNGF